MKTPINTFDVFFLSYDEPNAEKHWAILLDTCPWAERIHGVKGFDAVHRQAAMESTTDWFVTVDADNIVKPEFFDLMVDIDPQNEPNRCYSWNARNMINNLEYGNGGLKLWSKNFVLNMNTHENSTDERKAVDFCWEDDYKQVYETYSQVYNNGSAYQAFRVGYREGVKMVLDQGTRLSPELWRTRIHPSNMHNLRTWATIGSDVENGIWAIYGVRYAMIKMLDPTYDYKAIRDYEWFDEEWKTYHRGLSISDATEQVISMGDILERKTNIVFPYLEPKISKYFKEMNANGKR